MSANHLDARGKAGLLYGTGGVLVFVGMVHVISSYPPLDWSGIRITGLGLIIIALGFRLWRRVGPSAGRGDWPNY